LVSEVSLFVQIATRKKHANSCIMLLLYNRIYNKCLNLGFMLMAKVRAK